MGSGENVGSFGGKAVSLEVNNYTNSGKISASNGKVEITVSEVMHFAASSIVEATESIEVSGLGDCKAGAKFILRTGEGESSVTISRDVALTGLLFDSSDDHFKATIGDQAYDLQVMGNLEFPPAE
jgi:hypothetical protein